ncbi:MAG: hypothetical protein ACI9K5_002904 [Gammaproteobacteria bacterium]|jgi:hypothetical protein
MKQLSLCLFTLLVVSNPTDDREAMLSVDTRIEIDVHTTYAVAYGPVALVVDGNRSPFGSEEEGELRGETTRRFVDRILSVEEGKRTEVERHYLEIQGRLADLDPLGEDQGVLAERKLRITRAADAEADAEPSFHVELVDDLGAVEENYLEGITFIYPEERLLPSSAQEPGDVWTKDGAAVLDCLGLDVGIDWFEESGVTFDFVKILSSSVAGDVSVTYPEAEEGSTRGVARLDFSFALEGDRVEIEAKEFLDGPIRDPDAVSNDILEITSLLEGAGSIWLDPDTGELIKTKSHATGTAEVRLMGPHGNAGSWIEMKLSLEIESERRYSFAIHGKDD